MTPQPDGAAVRVEGLRRQFNGTTAVEGLDLEITKGEIYGFLGPNGAGKSTTVRMLCTLLAPTGGRAIVAGYDVATDPGAVRLRIGAALQDVALDPKQTGTELLRLQGLLYGLPKRAVDRRVAQLGELIDLGDALDRRIATYSGGMRRRLDLAAALVHNPEILFLDEPTTGLDPISRARVWAEVRRLNDELGMTIFLTTQYLEEADELAHRVGIIDHGRMVAEGTPADLKRAVGSDLIVARIEGEAAAVAQQLEAIDGVQSVEAHGNELVIATDNGSAAISPVAVALAACEVRVRDLTLRTPTLDDVFLDLTGTRIEHDTQEEEAPHDVDHCNDPITIPIADDVVRARPAGFLHDLVSVAGRALRAVPRDMEAVIPPVFIALFFFIVNIATLEQLTASIPGFDYTAFQMATAILLGVTGVSRAGALVLDVQDQYFDRLLLTPVRRSAILLGHMAADVAVAAALTIPIILLGLILGVRFEAGPIGMVVFVALASLWSLAFAGFGYAIALKTGNPGRGQLELPAVLPVPVPHVLVRAPQ